MSDAQSSPPNMAVFFDYENVALGARDAGIRMDAGVVIERMLERGHVIVKKAYADWTRYGDSRRSLHELGIELVEVPHLTQAGKNSADIRLVVDALDLSHTKNHLESFVIVSGDSDFSPLVAKLRENGKHVIGVGVENSTSDLLAATCDEFLFYDDMAREHAERSSRRGRGQSTGAPALDLLMDTVEAIAREHDGPIHGSVVKQVIRRKRPGFSERHHGFRNFSDLLEAAANRRMLEIEPDDRAGGYYVVGAA